MSTLLSLYLFFFGFMVSCDMPEAHNEGDVSKQESLEQINNLDTATFAGGCFWCIEASFEQIKGVKEAVSGYAGGEEMDPTYREVSYGKTGHAETVQIYYDADQINYNTLLKIFFTAHDPTQLNRQGPDIGPQYRSAIFYHDEQQLQTAQNIIDSLDQTDTYSKDIVTELNPYAKFYKAEEYHQDYEEKHPNDRYIQNVSRPKINKVRKEFKALLKE